MEWCYPSYPIGEESLIANNLIASTLWHKLMVLDPPKKYNRLKFKSLWLVLLDGTTLVKAAVLYLPVHEGDKGLIDIVLEVCCLPSASGTTSFISQHQQWMDVACALLHNTEEWAWTSNYCYVSWRSTLDGLTVFYQSVLQSWQTLSFSREWDGSNQWVYDEPLFFNPLISVEFLCSDTVRVGNVESRSPQNMPSTQGTELDICRGTGSKDGLQV